MGIAETHLLSSKLREAIPCAPPRAALRAQRFVAIEFLPVSSASFQGCCARDDGATGPRDSIDIAAGRQCGPGWSPFRASIARPASTGGPRRGPGYRLPSLEQVSSPGIAVGEGRSHRSGRAPMLSFPSWLPTGPSYKPRPPHLIRIESGNAGQRIDNFLLGALKGVPQSHIYRILRRGEVRVNRGRIRQHYRLRAGDQIRIPPLRTGVGNPRPRPAPGLLEQLEASIVHEDADLLVLDKPAGLAVHGGSGLRLGVIEGLRCLRPALRFMDLAHRLDRDTSGLLIVAKRRRPLLDLHRAFREGRVEKRYLVLVKGRFDRARRIDSPLAKGVLRSGERFVSVSVQGQASRTDFVPLTWSSRSSFLEARPRTGRTHQIRVHAADAGHPVGGDPRYGDREYNRSLERCGLRRMFLHAHSLRIREATSGRHLSFEAPLPGELRRVLDALGLGTRKDERHGV